MTDTILIVDDSSFIVEGLVTILKKSYRPLAVYSGQQCLDMLKKESPSIIILDIMMEPMDGWETLARIKENPATRHIPVLMFSAKKISALEAEEHRISINDFVSKPVNTKKLIEAIEKVLQRQEANRLNIKSWQSAGISQERIDEFTSLMTNLDVDMSLLQNMMVQLSLVHADDKKSRKDFEEVIAAIKSRIQEERLHEEELSKEMHKSVNNDIKIKEHAGSIPAMNESGPEYLPARSSSQSATQLEHPGSSGIFKDETNSSATIEILSEVRGLQEIAVKKTNPIPVIPDTTIIPKPVTSDFLFEDDDNTEPPLVNPVQMTSAELPDDELKNNPLLYGQSSGIDILKTNTTSLSHSLENPAKNIKIDVSISSARKVPVAEQKSPVPHEPINAKTLEKKPVAPVVPIVNTVESGVNTVESGTDTSLRLSPSPALGKTSGTEKENPFLPPKKIDPPSVGFFSKIISMIVGIFKRH